ncbi:MAG TPA: TonB-dependent receptor plug domain-containing protein, partial [Phnomibacter sp.]|nr:TonB-dependent receptor plug domain-containing protein [Phnomibacter sp.]
QLGFATQEVKGAALEKAREPNLMSSLNGRVAGLQIFNKSTLFETPSISLRGATPLVVIDGVPTRTDFWNLNPDDIENISVLKSNAAALLYGSLGVNGAIQITTKKGKPGAKGVEVSINNSTQVQAGFLNLPETQTDYGMGWAGYYAFIDGRGGGGWYDNYGYVWGPKLNQRNPYSSRRLYEVPQYNSPYDPNRLFPFTQRGFNGQSNYQPIPWITRSQNNLQKFLRPQLLNTTNVSIAAKTDNADYRISVTHMFQQGQVPNTHLNATTLNASGAVKLTNKLKAEAIMSYNRQYSPNYPETGYGPSNLFYNILLWMGPEVDINDLRNYWKPGRENLEQLTYNYTWYNNPWFIANEQLRNYQNDIIVGQVNLTYDITPNLKALVRSGVTYNSSFSDLKTPYSYINYGASRAPFGQYSQSRGMNTRIITDALLTYNQSIGEKFELTASAGASNRYDHSSGLSATTVGGLAVPRNYNLGNSRDPLAASNSMSEKQVNSLFGYADLGYDNFLYLNVSARNDWTSSLLKPYNSFFYPSASLSFIVSEVIRFPQWVTMGKIRGAVADVSSDLAAYQVLPVYSRGLRWDGMPSLNLPGNIYDPAIQPNKTISRELGTEWRFLNNRLGLDVTWFSYLDKNSVRSIPLSQASGFNSLIVNGDIYERKGLELMLSASPIRTKNFGWDVNFNYSRLR